MDTDQYCGYADTNLYTDAYEYLYTNEHGTYTDTYLDTYKDKYKYIGPYEDQDAHRLADADRDQML